MKRIFGLARHLQLCTYLYGAHFRDRTPIIDGDCAALAGMWHMPVLDFDVSGLRGKRIESAELRMQPAGGGPLLEVELTTVTQQWDAGHATYYERGAGRPWAGGIASEVLLGRGNSQVYREKVESGGGMLSVRVGPALVYAMANDRSFGLGLLDFKSRSYAACGEDIWAHEDWLAVKRININPQKGAVPVLEVEYVDEALAAPPPVNDLRALGAADEESFDTVRVVLHWDVDSAENGEYRYYRIFLAEGDADGDAAELEPYRAPAYDGRSGFQTADIGGLKPDTDYTFAVVLCNACAESASAYVSVHTPKAQPHPSLPGRAGTGERAVPSAWLKTGEFSVFIADDIVKVNPVTGRAFEDAGQAFEEAGPAGIEAFAPAGFGGHSVALDCSPGERLGLQVIVENTAGRELGLRAVVRNNALGEGAVRINKVWYIKCAHGWFPEVAVPVERSGAFGVPFRENGIPGQRFQSLFVDVEVPENLRPGRYGFEIAISGDGGGVHVPVELRVQAFRLDRPDFVFDLNGYIAVPEYMGAKYGDPDFAEIEKAYYAEAWRHGLAIDIVPYDQRGRMQPGFAPEVGIVDGKLRVTDWAAWDDHFGKYLDGSYLEGVAGKRVPITHMFLPIHENWPLSMAGWYRVKAARSGYPEIVNEQKLRTSRVAEDFMPGFREGVKEVVKDFIRHADEKGWGGVTFQFFLNNKNFYKEDAFMDRHGMTEDSHWLVHRTIGNRGEGTSWWLLDEPNFRDDLEALAYFGGILGEAKTETGSGSNFRFRVDISGYNYMGAYLDGLIGIPLLNIRGFAVCDGIARGRKARYGETPWVYGCFNDVDTSNLESFLWAFSCYMRGANGVVPWYNYATDDEYGHPSQTACLYPGNRFGLTGPAVSLRLKAARKCLELIKYVETFKRVYGYSDLQMREYVSQFISMEGGETVTRFRDDAGIVLFGGGASAAAIEELRMDLMKKVAARISI